MATYPSHVVNPKCLLLTQAGAPKKQTIMFCFSHSTLVLPKLYGRFAEICVVLCTTRNVASPENACWEVDPRRTLVALMPLALNK
jgi:hypothetical protein